jgi:hypothetical protein
MTVNELAGMVIDACDAVGIQHIWLPTAEDLVIQKVRWGRPKDLDDARDVILVQGIDTLDIARVRDWCHIHGRLDSLASILEEVQSLG